MARARRPHGFSFMELIIVMGAMAMLLGLAVGYIGNIGQSTKLAQARAILSETAYRCVNGSTGGRRAILTLRRGAAEDGTPVLLLGAALARPVLTHQFETLDFASEAREPVVSGNVELVTGGGRVGNCAKFTGGDLELPAQSVFAMTEGIELDVWVKPEPRRRMMTIVRGEEAYEVLLVQAGDSDSYDVRLQLNLRRADEDRRLAPAQRPFDTRGGPLTADGRWRRLQVTYDGLEATIRVNGIDVYSGTQIERRPGDALLKSETEQIQRIVVGEGGAVMLTISSGSSPYYGEMDGLQLRGVFRSQELERELPGELRVLEPPEKELPLRIVFANGGLDPDVHKRDQVLRFLDESNPTDAPLMLTLGLYGTISARYEKAGEGGAVAPQPVPKPTPVPEEPQ